ncbi:hypothetical protein ACFQH6_19600 [Halobacteriaceae archaeon GCM10025711]
MPECDDCNRHVQRRRFRVLVRQTTDGLDVRGLCPRCQPSYPRDHQYRPTRWPPTGGRSL